MRSIKFSVLLILLLSGNYISGQNSPLSLTVNAGTTLSDMRIKDYDTDMRFGFRGGVGLEMDLSNNFFLQTGLNVAMKGSKATLSLYGWDINGDGYSPDYYLSEGKIKTTYLILPLKAGYRLNVAESTRVNFSFGPYFGYGIGGKYKGAEAFEYGKLPDGNQPITNIVFPNVQYSTFEYDSFSDETLKRFDMGLTIEAGIEYKRILLNIGYEYGFINHSRTDYSSYNSSLFMTLGYRINIH